MGCSVRKLELERAGDKAVRYEFADRRGRISTAYRLLNALYFPALIPLDFLFGSPNMQCYIPKILSTGGYPARPSIFGNFGH